MPFRSFIAVSTVCEQCRSVVVRKDFGVESLGTMPGLPHDLSPLQLGTQGRWKERAFTLVGRLRLHREEASWNQWCADFGDGSCGWIAETMGFFRVSFAQKAPELDRLSQTPAVGSSLKIRDDWWNVSDVKEARCIAAEGELPFPVKADATRRNVDLTGAPGQSGSIEMAAHGNHFLATEYALFDDLHLAGMRKVPGWDQDADVTDHRREAPPCPQCATPVSLRAEGLTMSAVCGSCGAVLDTSTPTLKKAGQVAQTTLALRPVLPLGTRGVLRQETWEVIGYNRRQGSERTWEEFLLFNPWLGFRSLVTSGGHWTLMRVLPGHHTEEMWDDRCFDLSFEEEVVTTDVLGEFYGSVKMSERVLVRDGICSPRILSRQHSLHLKETTWSGGVYVTDVQVAEAFNVVLPPPSKTSLDVGDRDSHGRPGTRPPFILVVLGLVLIQLCCLGYAFSTNVLNASLAYDAHAVDTTLTTPVFELEGSSAPLNVHALASDLPRGGSLALTGALVNARSQHITPLPLEAMNDNDADSELAVTLPAVSAGEYYPALCGGRLARHFHRLRASGGHAWRAVLVQLWGGPGAAFLVAGVAQVRPSDPAPQPC